MTLPNNWILPLNEDRLSSGDPLLIGDYLRELIYSLTTMYEDLAESTNGEYRQFLPEIYGTTVNGKGTYTIREGWYLRKNLMVDYWYACTWTGHTGAGNAFVQLPYKVKFTDSNPFVGEVHGQYNYAATYTGMFGLGISQTFQEQLFLEGPANIAVAPLPLLTSGTLYGHIRYIGQEIEN